jgi:hypothetical protein
MLRSDLAKNAAAIVKIPRRNVAWFNKGYKGKSVSGDRKIR